MAYSCAACGVISPTPRCAAHQLSPRGKGASWNGNRSRSTQANFRRMLIARDGLTCRDCGATNVPLQAHHTTPTNGRLLCNQCHRDTDDHAR